MNKMMEQNNKDKKYRLRQEILWKRKQMVEEDVIKKSNEITNHVLETTAFLQAKNLLLYAPIQQEVDTRILAREAIRLHKTVYYPKVNGDSMHFYAVTKTEDLQVGYQSILEPIDGLPRFQGEQDTCMIVPGVVFDCGGNRIGYGKGFYDRFLTNDRSIDTIGVCYALQLVEKLPVEEFDIPLNRVITEYGVD
ncbi:MAG: 5-formyltetrahydrofolate cyclo-ligase [Eubacteriales bacterium]